MGMFDFLNKKDPNEELDFDPAAPPVPAPMPAKSNDFVPMDMASLKKEQADADQKKAWMSVIGNAAQGLSNVPTAYELLYNKKIDRPDLKGMMEAGAKSIQDPTERQAKLYQAYKNAKEGEKLNIDSAEDKKLDDPNGVYAKFLMDRGLKQGLPFTEGMTPREMMKFSDPKKLEEIKAQSAVDLDKQKQIHKMDEVSRARDKDLDRKSAIEKIVLEKGLEAENKRIEGDKNLPQNVYQAATFGKRVEDANNQMEALMKRGYDPTSLTASAQDNLMPERFRSEDSKLMDQSKRNFVNAVLRRESGSAISSSEFDSANKQYFPGPGDSQKVLEQKKRNRDVALAGLKTEGAKAWDRTEQNIAHRPSQSSSQQTVRIKDPAGNIRLIPVNQAQAALQAGGELVDSVAGR